MHSKVIITALIFGLAVGFTSGGMNDVKATKSLAKNDVCDVVEPAGKALRSLQPRKAAAASTTVRPDLFITRSRTDTFNSGGDWYTFTAPFSGRFWFQSTSSNVDPIAQIYLGKGTSYGTVSPDAGNRDDISTSDRNFRFALDMTCGTTYYILVTEYYGRSGSYTISASHSHDYTYRATYYSSYSHRRFCSCGAFEYATLNVDDEFSGHGRNMVHCSVCDTWIDLIPSGHTHSYSWCSYVNQNSHRYICDCGNSYTTSHSFDAVYNIGDYQVKHCSGCNAWIEVYNPHVHSFTYSYDTYNDGMHRAYCSCGQSTLQQHTFNEYIEIGHGHNGMIRCSQCDAYVEPDVLTTSNSSSGYIAANNAKWHIFKPATAGSYTFRLTGTSSYTYMEFYLGNYPTSMLTSFTTENIGAVSYTRTVNENQAIFVRVRGNNWASTNYTLTVTPAHTHNYNQLVDYDNYTYHKLVCSCGDYILEPHVYDTIEPYNKGFHRVTCACGRSVVDEYEHTFCSFLPYGHGHNDMIICADCGAGIEVTQMYLNGSYQDSVAAYDADWFFFVAEEDGTYLFETTGDYDPCCDVYVGNYPVGNGSYFDDEGQADNFMFTWDLEIGDKIFLRVRGYDWYKDVNDYTLTVTKVN